jgi:acyl transferase domain-containing protein/NADPH:quinone reductase-like Zn-dependent oxidoreductase/acyl carrier protein
MNSAPNHRNNGHRNNGQATDAPTGAIAIIGVSGRYPGGANSPDLLWETLKSGTDAVGEAAGDRWDLGWHHPDSHRAGRVYTRAGGFLDRIDGFDPEFFGLSPRESRQMDPQQRLLLELAWEAHEDAGIAPRSRAGSDTGVFVGISSNDYASLEGAGWPDAYSNTGSSFSIAANRISYIFDLHGPSVAVDTACSSSIVCVHQACMSLLAGECSTALAGGVSILVHIRPWLGFARASMLSPTGRCKSFDAGGDGYVRSEGGGLVLLKPLAAAERDGDRVLGVILASGVNQDGRTMGLSMPNGDAQEKLLRKVYSKCAVRPEDVFYVEAHGTGTAVGDPIECGALGRVLGTPRADGSRCLIGSVKSNIGHLEAASGIAGLTKVLLMLRHREIPGNLHFSNPNPKIDFEQWKLQVVTSSTPLPVRERPIVIGVNSFGFGGTNAHLAIQEYRPATSTPKPAAPAAGTDGLLFISGHSEAALRAVARRYVDLLGNPATVWEDVCAAAATCRSPLRYRLVVAAATSEEAAAKLQRYISAEPVARLATGSAAGLAPVAFVYSGNGPQWWGMGRELLAENPVFRAEIEAIDAIFAPLAGWSLIREMHRPESENRIALTEVAQPMLFALQLGLTQVLRSAGIQPAAVLGHSVGEAAAAWACGALSREQATRVIFHRSREQATTAGQGRMAALGVSAEEAIAAMANIPGWLELAATNSPQSVTVAGDPAALEQIVEAMTAAGKFARVLPLNYPFHTRAMEAIRAGLVESLADLTPGRSSVPFISTVDGAEKPGTDLGAEYWYRNVREPVRFSQAVIHLLKENGVTLFLEIGPHPVLKDYVLQAAKTVGSAAVALQTLRRPGRQGPEPESDNLWSAICAAHANGASRAQAMFTRPAPPPRLPLYPWQHERHWRGNVILPDIFSPIKRDHPLLGHRVPSADALWENTLDTNQLPYLKDHVVQKAVLFPAAGYIEMALAAGQIALGKGTLDVENFEVLRPLAIPAQGDPLIQTSIDARDGTVEISSRPDRDATEWTMHARGRLSRTEGHDRHEPSNLTEVVSRMPVTVNAADHYAGSSRRGLDYGPAFQGVGTVHLTDPGASRREAMAEIRLPFLESGGLEHYLTHPSLLDSCVQVLISLIGQNEKRDCCTIPVQLGRVRSIAPLTSGMFCHVVMRSESERSVVADFRVTDAAGNLLLTIDQARCQKVDFQQAAPAPLTSEWWRPDSLAPALVVPAALPAPADTLAGMAADLERIASENRRSEFYTEIRPRIERLVGAYAAKAIAALGPGDAPFDLARLARKAGVKRGQATLLAKLVRICEEDGQLTSANGAWRWNQDRVPESPEMIWSELFRRYPRYQAEALLLAQAGDNLVSTLRGEDGGDLGAALLDQLQDTSPFQAPYNQIVRATIEKLVAAWPAQRPMRVLEVGGAGGGLAAWVLPVLPAQRADYVFTDPSEAALGRAEHRFAAHRFARFATLDLSRDLVEQGQPAGYFDLVIGANALGSTNDPRALLARLRSVMAPGGQLLTIEANKDRFTDLVLGQHLGVYLDDLAAGGFEGAVALHDTSACPQGQTPEQSVLLARCGPVAPLPSTQAVPEVVGHLALIVEEGEESSDFCAALVQSLSSRGRNVLVTTFTGREEDLKNAVAAVLGRRQSDEVVYLAAADNGKHGLLDTQKLRCLTALHIVQSLETSAGEKPSRLTFVTRGAFPTANGQGPIDPGQSPLWGLGRVIGNEHSDLNIRMIDLHTTSNGQEEAGWLAAELLRRDAETEVQLSGGHRFVNRERLTNLIDEAREAGPSASAFVLDFLPRGGLDTLYLRATGRNAPAPHEVEIAVKAAGLNFRDVLWSMGMLPEEAVEHGFSGPTIGMECAGEIVRVGAAVTSLKPGDRVVAFASSCFASHVTTDGGSVARIPDGIDYASAATIPTAFLTAYYALDHLARLEAGETVLIHGAAGGVGLAAIQIAKLKGAKIIGTAGSDRKRRMLEMLGVDHVLSSRSLDFADEVMKITAGVGVDVVLNSLAGEAITKSLQCLRPFGRFLEIGKRDLYANSRIGLRPFRNNLSYFGIDADTLLIERPALARSTFRAVIDHFATGALRPLPFQEVPISRAAEAFRCMQQSRHVGKLIVSMQLDKQASLPLVRSANPIRPAATYLVTGGLGGFGLATAGWLVDQGATSLALVGRRGPVTEEALAGIAELQKKGAAVRAFAADIADVDSLGAVLAAVRAEMAPLAGIIHSAAVIEDAPILNLGDEQLERVLRPKLLGAWNLHQATLGDSLDMFVLYSSSSAVVGNPGQGAYVAANLYLDALALHRRSLGLPALAVGWGAIKDAGFLTRHEAVAGMLKSRTGLDATPAHEALADLGRLLAVGATRVSVARFDLQRLGQMLPGARVPRFVPIIPKGASASLQSEETLADLLKKVPAAEYRAFVLARVRDHAARVLGTSASQVNVDQPLAEMGLDSLMAVELAGGLGRDLGKPVSVMQMLSAGSLTAIAEIVLKVLGIAADEATTTPPEPIKGAVLQGSGA